MTLSTEVLVAIILGVPSLLVAVVSTMFAYMAIKQGRLTKQDEPWTGTYSYAVIPMYARPYDTQPQELPAKINIALLGDFGYPQRKDSNAHGLDRRWRWADFFRWNAH